VNRTLQSCVNDGLRHVPRGAPISDCGSGELSTIRAPNGVAGFCGRSGLSASARNPDGLPMEPTLIATTMAIGGVSRNCSNTRKKTNRSPVIIRKSRCAFSKY
jgi:hypothetical protein